MTKKIELGDEVKDVVTGFRGIVVARTEWLYGCARISIQPPVGSDGKVPDLSNFDEPSIVVIKKNKVAPASNTTGGVQKDSMALARKSVGAK